MTAESSSNPAQPRARWPGLLVAAGIGLLAAQPLLFGQLRAGSDTYFHAHRLWQVHELINQGVWFSRWSPDLPFGFGFPVLNYYAPLSYYLAELCARLTGALIPGYILALVLILCATAVGMFAWLREIFDERAAWVAAAALVFAPNPIANIYSRGAIAEPMAVVFMPLVLWAVHRLIKTQRRVYVVWLAATFALLALSHNVSAFLFAPFVVAYALLLGRRHLCSLIRVGVGLGWGVCLAAFFVLPALLERDLVQLKLIYATFFYDYHNNFLHLSEFFSSPPPLDPRDMNGNFRLFVGVLPAALGAVGLLGLFRLRPSEQRLEQRSHIGFAFAACLVCLFMTVPQSLFIWDAIPFLRVLQFPTRFMMPAAFFLAVLIGASCQVLMSLLPTPRPMLKTGVAAIGIAALMAFVTPMLIVLNRFPLSYAPTALEIAQLEKQYNVIGTTNTGEYLPTAVQQVPPLDQSPLLRAGRRLDPQSLPPATRVLSETYAPLRYDLTFDTPQPFSATFSTFYFPGWQAFVDGAPVEISPSTPYGFIRVPVPAGQHTVLVAFGDTPIRTFANGLSGMALLVWLGCLARYVIRNKPF